MPMYDYKCSACGVEEVRIAGLDDRTVICTDCDSIMNRINDEEELFQAYWSNPEESSSVQEIG